MLQKTDIERQLFKIRAKRINEDSILAEVQSILEENELDRSKIVENLLSSTPSKISNLKLDLLETERIYHISDIKKLCVTYRLRFLDSHYFKGDFPEEAVTKVRELENKHETELSNFKIVAPSKLLKLENADDPLLFSAIGNDYFYLIHKWGTDLHPLRKILMWPYKSFENLIITILFVSVIFTAITPMEMFTKNVTMQEYLLMYLFMFKAVAGIVLFYGFAKGKNFNTAIWDSKYYNA